MPLFLRDTGFAEASDLAACRQLLSNGSRSFYAASFFLPKSVREPAAALYAFCRVADDAIDLEADRHGALARLRERLERIYRGTPLDQPIDRAMAGAVERFHIPRVLPEALLEGFEWDAEGRLYEDIEGVCDYSARVASAVGAMMAALMGVRSPQVLARACDLGTAMQLSNICRDVGEDAANGRIYLPLNWLREAGIEPAAWLRRPVFSPALGAVVARVLALADDLYQRAESGIARLPVGCRPGIYAARLLYAEIGHEVARNGYDSVSRRAVVPAARKLSLLSQALAVTPFPGRQCDDEPLAANRFLVDAVAAAPPITQPGRAVEQAPASAIKRRRQRRRVSDQMLWVLDLFQTLEERDRLAMYGGPVYASSLYGERELLGAMRNGAS